MMGDLILGIRENEKNRQYLTFWSQKEVIWEEEKCFNVFRKPELMDLFQNEQNDNWTRIMFA